MDCGTSFGEWWQAFHTGCLLEKKNSGTAVRWVYPRWASYSRMRFLCGINFANRFHRRFLWCSGWKSLAPARELAFGTEFSVRKTAQILSLQRESVPSRWRRAAADRCGKIAVHLWDRERRCLPEPIGRRHPAWQCSLFSAAATNCPRCPWDGRWWNQYHDSGCIRRFESPWVAPFEMYKTSYILHDISLQVFCQSCIIKISDSSRICGSNTKTGIALFAHFFPV